MIDEFALGILRPVFVAKVAIVAAPDPAAHSGGKRRVARRIVNVSVVDINLQAMHIHMPLIPTVPNTDKSKNIETWLPRVGSKIT